jgi:hypothetical protein
MRAWRWPILALLPLLVAGAFVVDRSREDIESGSSLDAVLVPSAPGSDAIGSTWYCAAGTAEGSDESVAEQTLHVQNAGDQPVTGRITAFPSEGSPTSIEIEVAGLSRSEVEVGELVEAPFASALVEVESGDVAVQHEVSGPGGRALGSCASAPSAQWFFANGTTQAGTRLLLALFNPFPSDAVVDISFETDDGTRTPQDYQGLVVPAEQVTVLEVSEVVTLRNELATTVVVRSGRVVAEQLQISEGGEDPATEEPDPDGNGEPDDGDPEGEDPDGDGTGDTGSRRVPFPPGLALTLGAPLPSEMWFFPDGVGATGYEERFVVFNPTDQPAEVELHVLVDDPEVNVAAEPFELTVGGRRFGVVETFADGRVPEGVAHAAVVRSLNGVPVVAERVVLGGDEAVQPGVGYTVGAPVAAGQWLVPVASVDGASAAAIIVFNPSATDLATVSLRALDEGRGGGIGAVDEIAIPPGGRAVVDLSEDDLARARLSVEVTSDAPVVVETRFGFDGADDLSYLIAVAVRPTIGLPERIVGEISDEAVILGD